MNILFLRGFNNYFNRIVKKYSTLTDYQNNSTAYVNCASVNFNPNDGVVTELIVGNENQKENSLPLDWENIGTPDYCVCYETSGTPAVNTIISRWFILESERTRSGQYRLALKRDVVAEHFNEIMNAPCFVEKGIVNDKENPLLYNNESMTYNQIKKDEVSLKDNSKSGWIVGYYAKNYTIPVGGVSITAEVLNSDGEPADYYDEEDLPFSVDPDQNTIFNVYYSNKFSLVCPITYFHNAGWGQSKLNQGFKVYNYNNETGFYQSSLGSDVINETNAYVRQDAFNTIDPVSKIQEWGADKFDSIAGGAISTYNINNHFNISPVMDQTKINIIGRKYFYDESAWPTAPERQASMTNITNLNPSIASTETIRTKINSYMTSNNDVIISATDIASFYNNKYVKINGKYYRMSISATGKRYDVYYGSNTNVPSYAASNNSQIFTHYTSDISSSLNTMLTSMNSDNILISTTNNSGTAAIATSQIYTVVLSLISSKTLNLTITQNRQETADSSCNLFAIPYGYMQITKGDGSEGQTFTTTAEEGLSLARAIAKEMGDTICYDLQLLPYAPSQLIRDNCPTDWVGPAPTNQKYYLDLSDFETSTYNVATKTFAGTTTNCTVVFFPSSCKGTFDIDITYPLNSNASNMSALDFKVLNETTICRLASPNYNGLFEFSLAKNGGNILNINVDYTYKPYLPYIHINPDFKFLYGQDWDDSRGLICNGDFSLSFINDYWETYQNNNKNYQSIFNRQIANMDVNNQIAKEKLDWQTFAGYFGGGITGAIGGGIAGAKAGGGYGALAGAIGGAYMGTVGSIIGGEMDKEWLEREQKEAKRYAIDMYGYQLGNIKAMPYSLSRSESLNNNNKIFPFIEFYDCTEKEKELLVEKIKYNGMTIMSIGKLSDYSITPDFKYAYLQGEIIRLENLSDDFHIADAIYQEVKKGFYVPSGGL